MTRANIADRKETTCFWFLVSTFSDGHFLRQKADEFITVCVCVCSYVHKINTTKSDFDRVVVCSYYTAALVEVKYMTKH